MAAAVVLQETQSESAVHSQSFKSDTLTLLLSVTAGETLMRLIYLHLSAVLTPTLRVKGSAQPTLNTHVDSHRF